MQQLIADFAKTAIVPFNDTVWPGVRSDRCVALGLLPISICNENLQRCRIRAKNHFGR